MSLVHSLTVFTFRLLTSLICHIDAIQLDRVPHQGPLIIVTNHVNVLEIPIIYTRLQPRPVHGLVYADRWKHAWSRLILEIGHSIPLRRGEADFQAIHRSLELLKAGHILIISPEGTRSGHGRLQVAHPGVVVIAQHSQAPLLPVGYYGAEGYKDNLSHLKRTDFHISVGQPFRLRPQQKTSRLIRQQMLDEIMYQLAKILPEQYRGIYSDLSHASQEYLLFI